MCASVWQKDELARDLALCQAATVETETYLLTYRMELQLWLQDRPISNRCSRISTHPGVTISGWLNVILLRNIRSVLFFITVYRSTGCHSDVTDDCYY